MGVTSSLQAEVKSHLSLLCRAVAPQPSYIASCFTFLQWREASACGLLLVLGMAVYISYLYAWMMSYSYVWGKRTALGAVLQAPYTFLETGFLLTMPSALRDPPVPVSPAL